MRDEIRIKPSKINLTIASVLFSIWLIAVLISYTPLVQSYWVNFTITLIISNTINIFFIIAILLVLYGVERKMITKQIDQEGRSN